MTDDEALKILSGGGWYDPHNADDPRPDWSSAVVSHRAFMNAAGIGQDEPFVIIDGSFTREQLLALLHFHPDPAPPSSAELEQRLITAKIPVTQRLRQLRDLARQIEVRLVPDLVTTSDRVLWVNGIQLLNDIHAELSIALGLEPTKKESA
jgi:hypothetical protein